MTYHGDRNWLGKPHGQGIMEYTNGDSYEGFFVKGKWHGYGMYDTHDRKIYGNFMNDATVSDSYYTVIFKNSMDKKYIGQLDHNFREHGFGTKYYNHDKPRKGMWVNGRLNKKLLLVSQLPTIAE
jgi:hypothetical protein